MELEAGLPTYKMKFPSITEPIYRMARALALDSQQKRAKPKNK